MARKPEMTADPVDVAVGARIRLLRKMRGMSQQALAEAAGVTFQQIQKYENGANRISFSRLVQISRALRCRVTDLMDVFDGADKETAEDLDLLTHMRTPGALELLTAYEKLPSDVRSSLVSLVRTLAGQQAQAAAKVAVPA